MLNRAGTKVVFLAVVLRLVFVLWTSQAAPFFRFTEDSQRYDRLALNLIHRHEFRAESFTLEELDLAPDYEGRAAPAGYFTGDTFPDATHYTGPELKRVPGFAAFLGAVYWVCGYSPLALMVLQCLLGGLSCWLLYAIGKRLGLDRTGLVAAVLFAINPRSIVFAGKIQIETVFILTLLWLVLAAIRCAQEPTWARVFLLMGAAAVVTVTREMGMYAVLGVAPLILSIGWLHRSTGARAWVKPVLVGLTPCLVVFGWCARNYAHHGRFLLTTHTAFTEAWHFAPIVAASAWDVSEDEARLRICAELVAIHPEYTAQKEALEENPLNFWTFNEQIEFNDHAVAVARPYYAKYPLSTLSAFAGGAFWSLWSGVGDWKGLLISRERYRELGVREVTSEAKQALFQFDLPRVAALVLDLIAKMPLAVLLTFGYIWGLMIFLYASAVYGLVPLIRRQPAFALSALLLIGLAAAVTGPAGNNRLFVMAYPFISFFSAYGWLRLLSSRGARRAEWMALGGGASPS